MTAPLNPGDEVEPGTPGADAVICPVCGGDGRADGGGCADCGGTGKIVRGISGG